MLDVAPPKQQQQHPLPLPRYQHVLPQLPLLFDPAEPLKFTNVDDADSIAFEFQ